MKLYDRIKEITKTVGSGNMTLLGPVPGFSAFSDVYGTGDSFFYTISNGIDYEVGSGVISGTSINRNVLASSNGGSLINWPTGVKEIFVTYPAGFSAYTVKDQAISGIPTWVDNNILTSTEDFTWSGGLLYVNGSISGTDTITSDFGNFISGVYFQNSSSYQIEPFFRNVLDTDTGINGVIGLSGEVDQHIRFEIQGAGKVFAGPTATCGSPPCPSGYPVFRYLNSGDIPSFSSDKANYSPSNPNDWYTQPTHVTEALDYSVNHNLKVVGNYGFNNTNNGNFSYTFGAINYIGSTTGCYSVGINNRLDDCYTVGAFGLSNISSGDASVLIGMNITNTASGIVEIGRWNIERTERNGSIRLHEDGMVATKIVERNNKYNDGGASLGSESDGELPRDMWTIRSSGDDIFIDINFNGTVKTVSLGTAI